MLKEVKDISHRYRGLGEWEADENISGRNEGRVAKGELGRYGGQHTVTQLIKQVFIYMHGVAVIPIHHPGMGEDKHLMSLPPTAASSVSDCWLRQHVQTRRGTGIVVLIWKPDWKSIKIRSADAPVKQVGAWAGQSGLHDRRPAESVCICLCVWRCRRAAVHVCFCKEEKSIFTTGLSPKLADSSPVRWQNVRRVST